MYTNLQYHTAHILNDQPQSGGLKVEKPGLFMMNHPTNDSVDICGGLVEKLAERLFHKDTAKKCTFAHHVLIRYLRQHICCRYGLRFSIYPYAHGFLSIDRCPQCAAETVSLSSASVLFAHRIVTTVTLKH